LKAIPLLLLLVPAAALADEVFLKDAGTISGRIVEQTADTVRVDVGGGVVGVPMSRVERIQKGRSPLDDFDDQAKKLGPKDVAGWKKLARFAEDKGLPAQAHDAYKKVLSIAPDDADANTALGRVQLDGKWVTAEESYRARGFVKYNNEWMTPAEAQVLQTEAANDQARRDAEDRARDAEDAARDAEARAKDAEARAKKAERNQWVDPLVYGGWGFGVTEWPVAPTFNPIWEDED